MSRRVGVIAALVVVAIVLLCCLPWFDHLYGNFIIKVMSWQRHFHRQLVGHFVSFTQLPSATLATALALLSFGYGVFHAAGPGHGKAVITSYLATQQRHVGRGVALSMLAALLQGVVAIAVVSVLVLGLGFATLRAVASTRYLELLSFALVMALGLWLMVRAWRKLQRLKQPPARFAGLQWQARPAGLNAPLAQGSAMPIAGEACHCCGGHHVDTTELGVSWRDDLLAVLAMGMRPCSGALLVLGVAALMGQWLIGVLAVLAMAVGTGLTVSLLAVLTVFARTLVLRLMAGKAAPRQQQWAMAGCWVALAGGAVLVLVGGSLVWAAWHASAAGSVLGFQTS
ncbi:nickel/cobalt transporter [Carnimonas bestiolae]|uniref:nickel/cobalt transporter n=1 Tax=Carnimonas bestiolae TaxID=3402172 RepID=UPI003EDC38EA